MAKRDLALVPLSHDHHQALFQAMKMKRAGEDGRAEVTAGVLEYWRGHGARHFRIEEDLVLPAFARHHPPDDERVVRVLVDHVWIRERMDQLASDGLAVAELHALGERLDAHVRHEERVLFPLIEETLPLDELTELGKQIEAAEAE